MIPGISSSIVLEGQASSHPPSIPPENVSVILAEIAVPQSGAESTSQRISQVLQTEEEYEGTSTRQTQPSPFVVLPQEPAAHPHEQFIAARRLEHRLRLVVKGEARFDEASRALNATDAPTIESCSRSTRP